jgi:hypothetical protein
MAKRVFSPKHDENTRLKIQTSQLINRLSSLVRGEIEMAPHAVTAALGLLRKTLPDLSAVEHQGEVQSFVMRLPEPAQDTASWERTNSVGAIVGSKPDKPVTH